MSPTTTTTPATAPYSVDCWGSHPGLDNDNWYGDDCATLDEAIAAFDAEVTDSTVQWIVLTATDGTYRERLNPHYLPSSDDDDDEWQREIAMEQGMLHGVDAYNDAMGWGS